MKPNTTTFGYNPRNDRIARKGNFIIKIWSGGQLIETYQVINDKIFMEPNINGWSFFINDKIIYVAGTVTVEEV